MIKRVSASAVRPPCLTNSLLFKMNGRFLKNAGSHCIKGIQCSIYAALAANTPETKYFWMGFIYFY